MTGHSNLDMLEKFVIPHNPPGFIFQQDGATLPHFWMRLFLDVGAEEEVLLPGPLDLWILHH